MQNINSLGKLDSIRLHNRLSCFYLTLLGNMESILLTSGQVGDSLASHNGMKFLTKDQDHNSSSGSCAKIFHAGWWFKACQPEWNVSENGCQNNTECQLVHLWK